MPINQNIIISALIGRHSQHRRAIIIQPSQLINRHLNQQFSSRYAPSWTSATPALKRTCRRTVHNIAAASFQSKTKQWVEYNIGRACMARRSGTSRRTRRMRQCGKCRRMRHLRMTRPASRTNNRTNCVASLNSAQSATAIAPQSCPSRGSKRIT